jgi:thiol-disulfide isomerase/thioredoxin
MKKLFLCLLLIFSGLFFLAKPVLAQQTLLHFFWANGCPHCVKEKIFLENLVQKYPQIVVKDYEITSNRKNLELLQKTGQELKVQVAGVPFTVVGEKYVAGYFNDETTGKEIEEAVNCAMETRCRDVVSGVSAREEASDVKVDRRLWPKISLPLVGGIETKGFSLPVLTFVIALLDGFNPCAMWALVFLIGLLLGLPDKKRMWLLGSIFIITSALVYFLFLAAWLNLFLFLGFVVWVRVLIGAVAIGAGSYYLRDFWKNKNGACPVTGHKKRQVIFEKLRLVAQQQSLWLALGGIILLAVAVNMVELVCSAGLPAVYTKILSLANLPAWQYYLYLLFYIFIFMLDDLIVFFAAMITLQVTGLQGKYARYSHLVGGGLMLLVGLLLLFKPEWLMFG